MTSTRFRVLVLDPVKLRRDRAGHALKLRYDVDGCGTLAEALVACEAARPHAIVATIRQMDDNGLVAGLALREKIGPGVFLLVHGPAGTNKSVSQRQTLAARYKVDAWNETALEADEIESVVWTELNRRHRPRAAPAAAPTLLERARAVKSEDVREFLTKDRPLIPTPPRAPDEEPGWIELLNAPPTAENLKKLLQKDITGGRRKSQG